MQKRMTTYTTDYDSYMMPSILITDLKFEDMSITSKVMYTILVDMAMSQTGQHILNTPNEDKLKRMLNISAFKYKQAKNELKKLGFLQEILTQDSRTFILKDMYTLI